MWIDSDGDGVKGIGESYLSGAIVELLDAEDDPIQQTTTGTSGAYAFTGLAPGTYNARFTAPAGYILEGASSVMEGTLEVASGQTTTADVPVYSSTQASALSGKVWHDADGNGVQDTDEAFLAGVLVELLDRNGTPVMGGNGAIQATTGTTGAYAFAGLAPGAYTVRFTAPSGYVMEGSGTTTWSAAVRTPGSDNVAKAGVYQPGTLSGVAWQDSDGDGVRDTGESVLAGVLVESRDGNGDPVQTTTSVTGAYSFAGLTPGAYAVRFTAPAGFALEGANMTGGTSIRIASGQTTVADLPAYSATQAASVSGSVWSDTDGNGLKGSGETFLAGVVVELRDAYGNPVLDGNGDPIQATTGAGGAYAFADLAHGTYTVRFTSPTGYVMQESRDAILSRSVRAPGPNTVVDAGAYLPGPLRGVVWLDLGTLNGDRDSGEAGLTGVTVSLYGETGGTVLDLDGDPVQSVTTGADGTFSLADLQDGTYTVQLTGPAGYAFEGAGVPVWLGRFTVGRDKLLSVGAYEQEDAQNPVAPPTPPTKQYVWEPTTPDKKPPVWRPRDPKIEKGWQLAKDGENAKFVPDVILQGFQEIDVLTIPSQDLEAIAPPGAKIPKGDTKVLFTKGAGVALTADELAKVKASVEKAMKAQYEGILKKTDARIKSDKAPPPTHEDFVALMQAIPLGIVNSGVGKVQAKLDGALAGWIMQDGLGIDPAKATVNTTFKMDLDKNWKLTKVTGGLDFKFGKDTVVFSPKIVLDPEGKIKSGSIAITIKY